MTPVQPFPGLSDKARARMLELGPMWASDIVANRKAVLEVYTPLLAAQDAGGIEVTRDQAYGTHARHKLDVYRQPNIRNAPVIVFVHGGAFVRGDKDANPQIYGNLPRYFARHGCVGINMEYRLAPEAAYPEGTQDVAQAMEWVRSHAQAFGGDPARIFLAGHSAGGAHAAAYVCDPLTRPVNGHGVAGLVLISARLRADARPDNPNAHGVRAYYGNDETLYEARSVVTHAENLDVPLLLAIAEFENPGLDVYALEMLHRVRASRRRSPRFMSLEHHNHTSIVAHFDTGEDMLGREILDFMAQAK
ncbi:alpha/beta hydrolase [Polaromonas sp.]|uniref:alpha/beta hydrolase n=1 Tax=Polaromonas sp. TaxID=1869339 RepID=UPI003BA84B1B